MSEFIPSDGFQKIRIFDEYFLHADKKTRQAYPVLTPLNETAELIWTGISSGMKTSEIAAEIASKYLVDITDAYDDVLTFCSEMEISGYIQRFNSGELGKND